MNSGVSVIIPTYNRAGLIGRAIESALAAMSAGDEILVIDDGSTDDTAAVVRRYGHAVRYVQIKNSGASAARNLGIRLAGCPLVTFLDSDDEWLPDKVALQRTVMDAFPRVVFCFSNIHCRHPDGEIIPDILSKWRTDPRVGFADSPAHLSQVLGQSIPFSSIGVLPKSRADFGVYVGSMYRALMEVNYVTCLTIMVRKELAGAAFHFPEDIRLMEAWICFAKLAKLGPAAYLDCELGVQITHAESRLTDADDIVQTTARIGVLQRVWGKDESFLHAHSARYQSLLKSQFVRRARLNIAKGRLPEAREDLQVSGGPLAYKLLASLPPGLVMNVLGVRQKLKAYGSHRTPGGA